ncbi:hypothetical protein DL93DRAFT_2102107 [Clavulina sp. PMI_390]|nr:hypothetical protein DL93DRAFT_2102107 [Clavulina sp. PMI_390]
MGRGSEQSHGYLGATGINEVAIKCAAISAYVPTASSTAFFLSTTRENRYTVFIPLSRSARFLSDSKVFASNATNFNSPRGVHQTGEHQAPKTSPTPLPLHYFSQTEPNTTVKNSSPEERWPQYERAIPSSGRDTQSAPGKRTRTHLKIATWNVWFAQTLCELRWTMLLEQLYDSLTYGSREVNRILNPYIPVKKSPDVICLQEIIPRFQALLLSNPIAQATYLTTFVSNVTSITKSRYGTIFLVKRELLSSNQWSAEASFESYSVSKYGRELDGPQEIAQGDKFGVEHIAGDKNERLALSILCGDMNIHSYREIEEHFLRTGWTDALAS